MFLFNKIECCYTNSKTPFGFFCLLLFELLFVCLSVSLYAMCLALSDVLVVLKMNFTVYWEIWKSRISSTFGKSIAGVRKVRSWGTFEMVIKITCAHLSQKIFVHNMRFLNSVFATESSELCTIHEVTVRVNCEVTVIRADAVWITRKTIIFIFNFRDLCI